MPTKGGGSRLDGPDDRRPRGTGKNKDANRPPASIFKQAKKSNENKRVASRVFGDRKTKEV